VSGRFVLYCDGASRGNPGPAAIGAVLFDPDGETVAEISGTIGVNTNNVAEYRALIAGLEAAVDRGVERLEVRLDSELLVRQVTGRYRVKAANLKPLSLQAARLLRRLDDVRVVHVPREQNTAADALANAALDADA
jgi:probable phosphoglycerate mutase